MKKRRPGTMALGLFAVEIEWKDIIIGAKPGANY